MAVGPIGGTAFLKINGLQYQLKGELEIQPNITQNEWEANQDLSVVFTQKGVVPYMAMKISDSGGLSIQALNNVSGATIQAQLINGKQYVLQQAGAWGEFKDDTTKGEISAKFGAVACFEMTN
jgi:Phage tail tube protein